MRGSKTNVKVLSAVFASAAMSGSGCVQTPPSVNAVDSGVDVMIDMSVPFVTAQVRFGNFVAGAAPVDLCIKTASDTAWTGPVIRTMAMRPGGVSYLNISQYVTLNAASYTVRAVPGSRSDCAIAYGGLPDLTLPPIIGGRTYTLIPFGDQSRPATVKINLFEDNLAAQGGQVRLRFINLSPDVSSADFGFGIGAGYQPVLTDAVSGDLGRAAGMTYATVNQQSNGSASVRPSGMSTSLITASATVTFGAGSVVSTMIGGLSSRTGADPLALKLIACDDSKAPQSGLSVCNQLN